MPILLIPLSTHTSPSKVQVEEPKRKLHLTNFHDFIMSTEDEVIAGFNEKVAWGDIESTDDWNKCKCSQTADISPSGVLGRLTGQKYQPLDGQILSVSVNFDHDC